MRVVGEPCAEPVAQRIGGDAKRCQRGVEDRVRRGDQHAPAAVERERHDPDSEDADPDSTAHIDGFVEEEQRDHQCCERRGAAHQRIDLRQLAVVIGERQEGVVAEMDDRRGDDEGPRRPRQHRKKNRPGKASRPQAATSSAIDISLSPRSRMMAFHEAWQNAAISTTIVTAGVIRQAFSATEFWGLTTHPRRVILGPSGARAENPGRWSLGRRVSLRSRQEDVRT